MIVRGLRILYIQSGLTIDQSLCVAGEGVSKSHKKSLEKAKLIVESGGSSARALFESVGLSKTLVSLIAHGESSGGLAKAFLSARSLLEREDELKKRCASAMMYPTVIGIFACFLTVGLVRGVMPQIIPMFVSLHVDLPLVTRVVISISQGLLRYGWIVCIALFVFSAISIFGYKKSVFIRSAVQTWCIALPLIGSLILKYALVVFFHSCGTLIQSGTSSSTAFRETASTVPLIPLQRSLLSGVRAIDRGVSIGSILNLRKMPPFISPLLSAGEMSGLLGESMIRVAEILDSDIENILKRVTALIEPAMMIVMGGAVATIALSIMMPIYDLSKVLQK